MINDVGDRSNGYEWIGYNGIWRVTIYHIKRFVVVLAEPSCLREEYPDRARQSLRLLRQI